MALITTSESFPHYGTIGRGYATGYDAIEMNDDGDVVGDGNPFMLCPECAEDDWKTNGTAYAEENYLTAESVKDWDDETREDHAMLCICGTLIGYIEH